MLHYFLSVPLIQMRKSSSVAQPAFIKPLINEMAGASSHMYPHAAISNIQCGEAEWDRNHLSDKCYLISALVQTVIQVCLVSFMTKALGFLGFCSFVKSGILLSSQLP